MFRKYFASFCALLLAFIFAAFNPVAKKAGSQQGRNTVDYYFSFTGSHGNEDNVNLWQEISEETYNSSGCSGANQGCRIATTSVSNPGASFPARKISAVPVDVNDVPQQTMANYEIKNKP